MELPGRVGDLTTDSAAVTWQGDVEDLLYDGESVDRTVDFEDGSVVVTSHRVLVFTPESDGKNFYQVDRPNVVGIALGHDGNATHVERGIRWGLIGLIMAGAGYAFDFGDLAAGMQIDGGAAEGVGAVGLGGLMGMLNTLVTFISVLDDLLTMFGALAILLSVAVFAFYVQTRERVLTIERAGDDAVLVPVSGDVSDDAVARIRSVVAGTEDTANHTPKSDPL